MSMRLTDSFSSLIAYIAYFQKAGAKRSISFDQLLADVLRLLSESEASIQHQNIGAEDYDQARFAICAWIDETILSSSWEWRAEWQKNQLQRRYYNTTDAGQEFFERLNNLGMHQQEVREIFYLCLAMGFKGQYCHEGDDYLLNQLKISNLKLLTGSSIGLPELDRNELFPESYPVYTDAYTAKGKKRSFLSPFTLLFITGPVVLYGVLFIIYQFILSNIGDNFLSTPM